MELRRPNLRITTPTSEPSTSLSNDWEAIRSLQHSIVKTSERIKQLSLSSNQTDTPPPNVKSGVEITVKRDAKVRASFPVHLPQVPSDNPCEFTLRKPRSCEINENSDLHLALKDVLVRLRHHPDMYVSFKQKSLSVRKMLSLSSKGQSTEVLLQVIGFLGQLMTDAETIRSKKKHKAVQTQADKSTNTTIDAVSRHSISPRCSAMVSPMRTPFTSTPTSPRNYNPTMFKPMTKGPSYEANEINYKLEDFTPLVSPRENSILAMDDVNSFIHMEDNDKMLANIQAQSERITALNQQICQTMATSTKLLHQTPIQESPGQSEVLPRKLGTKSGDLKVGFMSLAEIWGNESSVI